MLGELPYYQTEENHAEYVYRHPEPTNLTRFAGYFEIPYKVVVTPSVYERYVEVPGGVNETEAGRACDLMTALKQALFSCKRSVLHFVLMARVSTRSIEHATLRATLKDADEDGEPMLTVSLPGEQ